MPLTTLDAKTALIIIDLQQGIIALPGLPPLDTVIENAATLAAAFRGHGLPVVLVNVSAGAPGRTEQQRPPMPRPPGFTNFVPALNQQPADHIVTKQSWGAFHNTGLATYLRQAGVTQLVIAGVATSIGVETTARQAYEHGFNVTLAIDAMADTNADAHINSTTRIFPKLGETGSTASILGLLQNRGA